MIQCEELERNIDLLGAFFSLKRKKINIESKALLNNIREFIDQNNSEIKHLIEKNEDVEKKSRDYIRLIKQLSKLNTDAKEALVISDNEIKSLDSQLKDALVKIERLNVIEQLLSGSKEPNKGLLSFNDLVDVNFVELSSKVSVLAEEAQVFGELKKIQDDISIICNFSGIRGKSLVVLSGGFSSGKSQFLNSLALGYTRNSGHSYLKVGATPTTAVPTYVQSSTGSKVSDVVAYSSFGGSVPLSLSDFHQFTHNYIGSVDFDIRSIMPYASIAYPMKLDNISHLSFVDTPGIDASAKGATGNDQVTAENFIKQANALMWFVGIKQAGTIPKNELDFLEKIQGQYSDLPLYIVANQSDCKNLDDIEDILDAFEDSLDEYGIDYKGISAYSSFEGKEYTFRTQSIFDFIKDSNKINNIKESLLYRLERDVFDKYYQAFDLEENNNNNITRFINNMTLSILTKTGDIEVQELIQPELDELQSMLSSKNTEGLKRDFQKLHQIMVNCINDLFLNILEV